MKSKVSFISYKHDKSVTLPLRLAMSNKKQLLRLTGGCGLMSSDDSQKLLQVVLGMYDFEGLIFAGGTRTVDKKTDEIVPGITELPSTLAIYNKNVRLVGIAPRTGVMYYNDRLVISEDNEKLVMVHPEYHDVLLLQYDTDKPSNWEEEWRYSLYLMQTLQQEVSDIKTLHMFYNGGKYSEQELLYVANAGYPVLLINGSGRITDQYAADQEFLEKHSNVHVSELNSSSINSSIKAIFKQ